MFAFKGRGECVVQINANLQVGPYIKIKCMLHWGISTYSTKSGVLLFTRRSVANMTNSWVCTANYTQSCWGIIVSTQFLLRFYWNFVRQASAYFLPTLFPSCIGRRFEYLGNSPTLSRCLSLRVCLGVLWATSRVLVFAEAREPAISGIRKQHHIRHY